MAFKDFEVAMKVFKEYGPQLLDLEIKIKGKPTRLQLYDMLCLGEDFNNPEALSRVADMLPGMLTFFGVALSAAETRVAVLDRILEDFIQEKWMEALTDLTRKVESMTDLEGKKIATGLKKSPTQAEVRGAIAMSNKEQYMKMVNELQEAKEYSSMISGAVNGISARVKLVDAELRRQSVLASKGI